VTNRPVANCVADFNETEWKHELQIIDDLLPDHVLGVEMTIIEPAGEIMCGKLVPKKK
jgi:hypothetical protein